MSFIHRGQYALTYMQLDNVKKPPVFDIVHINENEHPLIYVDRILLIYRNIVVTTTFPPFFIWKFMSSDL